MDDYPPVEFSEPADFPEVPEVPDTADFSDLGDVPEAPEVDLPAELDAPEVPPEVPEAPADPLPPAAPDDLTFHPRPGGFETLPNPEGEPMEAPHTPEIPYGGGGPERF